MALDLVAASATFTPTAVAYSAGDIYESAKTFSFPSFGPRAIMIRQSILRIDHTALVASEAGYTLHFYSVTPPSALADNGAWDLPSGDRASYLGKIALGTPVDLGSTLWIETTQAKPIIIPSTSTTGIIYAYLVTDAGITPTAAARTVTLFGEF